MFIDIFNLSLTIIKDAFAKIGDNIGELPNHRREAVSREMIRFLLKNLSRYHHHHHRVTPILCHNVTHILPMYYHIYHPSPLYVDHHLLFM